MWDQISGLNFPLCFNVNVGLNVLLNKRTMFLLELEYNVERAHTLTRTHTRVA